ncbi:MAG: hypothetical protein K2P23_04075 [Lachnospiraceae bacterium]|nr:hypothetical protein [Lachnospiraceae bacterium]
MTNNELLLSISDMIDSKLNAGLRLMKNEMQDMKGELQTELRTMEQGLRSDMQKMEQELRSDIQGLRSDMQKMEQELKSDIHMLKLCQENLILPRLNTIESCYTDTYRRYRDDADQMEAVSADVDIMKKVIAEHSQRLQKLA